MLPAEPRITAYLALGANLGDPVAALRLAMDNLARLDGVELSRRSSLYHSAPIDSSGPDYVNAVVEIQTTLSAHALWTEMQRLELRAGRERPYRNAPRRLDLDVLLYGDHCICTETLTVPHPRMTERAFVLVPLAEIAPDRVTPAQLSAVASQTIRRD